ncbi:hypothetical protein [Streptomyces sp. NPDC058295]|uniref:hypothetical protein n=1 Tax=Streptomyces sp. NPDC058295 TaxID=3346431 RepID=UPI0036E9CB8C
MRAGIAQGVFTTPVPADTGRAALIMCQGVAAWYRADGPSSRGGERRAAHPSLPRHGGPRGGGRTSPALTARHGTVITALPRACPRSRCRTPSAASASG